MYRLSGEALACWTGCERRACGATPFGEMLNDPVVGDVFGSMNRLESFARGGQESSTQTKKTAGS